MRCLNLFFRKYSLVVFSLISLLVSSFVVANEEMSSEVLKERVEQRWGALHEHAFFKAYEFETPEYRKVFDKKLYVASFGGNVGWRFVKLIDVNIDAAKKLATVHVEVSTSTYSPDSKVELNAIPVSFEEKWLHIDDQWWHSLSK